MSRLRDWQDWARVGTRAIGYGSVSVGVGALLRRRRASQWAMLGWSKSSLKSLGIEVEASPLYLDPQAPCILVANHASALDILVLGTMLHGDYRWLAKAPLFKVPFLGWHLALAGHIPVHRGSHRGKNAHISQKIGEVIRQGASVLFFPEGTRSPDGQLMDFKRGAFEAAVEHQLPIIPLVLEGTFELMAKDAKGVSQRRERRCKVTVLEPLPPRSGEGAAEALKALAYERMSQALPGATAKGAGRRAG